MTQTVYQALRNNLAVDLTAFTPELIICGTIVLMLVLRLFNWFNRNHMGWWALVLTIYAFFVSWQQWSNVPGYDPRVETGLLSMDIFSGLLVYDDFTIFLRLFLYASVIVIMLACLMTGIPDREDSADFMCLLLGSTVGMVLMASANHLLMFFIGVEMASLPSYAMAGFLKGRRQSSEAALKYVVYGGGAAGVMLYGISLLAGKYGTAYLPDLAAFISQGTLDPIVLLGILFIMVGIGFKLAAVPFHFWCPDVFEGAAAEVAGFLSVASKGAALALLARFTLGLAGLSNPQVDPVAFERVAPYLVPALAVFAAVTVTFGNLAAYVQTNLKRLLAYSTIAHAGFMMMGLATLTRAGASAVLFYLVIYLIMNVGAFAVVAFMRNLTGSEDLNDFRGFIYKAPVLVIALAFFMLSLLGLPPLAGFAAKFQIFSVLYQSGDKYMAMGWNGLGFTMYSLLVIAGLNTVLSLFYYIKVFKVMILERTVEEVEGATPTALPVPFLAKLYAGMLAGLILLLGIFWNPLSVMSAHGVNRFHAMPNGESVRLAEGEPKQ